MTDILRIAPQGARKIPGHALSELAKDVLGLEERALELVAPMRAAPIRTQKQLVKAMERLRRLRYELETAATAERRGDEY